MAGMREGSHFKANGIWDSNSQHFPSKDCWTQVGCPGGTPRWVATWDAQVGGSGGVARWGCPSESGVVVAASGLRGMSSFLWAAATSHQLGMYGTVEVSVYTYFMVYSWCPGYRWHSGARGGHWCLETWVTSREVDEVTRPT